MRISDWSSDVCSSDRIARANLGCRRQRGFARALIRLLIRPRIGEDQRVNCKRLVEQQRARRVAISESDDARDVGCRATKRADCCGDVGAASFKTVVRSEEHTSELQSLMRISYAVFCLKKKTY